MRQKKYTFEDGILSKLIAKFHFCYQLYYGLSKIYSLHICNQFASSKCICILFVDKNWYIIPHGQDLLDTDWTSVPDRDDLSVGDISDEQVGCLDSVSSH